MARLNKFKSGDYVSCKKLNGEEFVGVYSHEYDCGDHLVKDGDREFCIRKDDCRMATDEEAEKLKTSIKVKKKADKVSLEEMEAPAEEER